METEKDERWYVQFDSGDVRLMTLDELDQAFEAGEVHAQTYLIQVGETQWQTLADVAGLDEASEDESQAAAPAAPPAPAPVEAAAPAAPAPFSAPAVTRAESPAAMRPQNPYATSVMPAVSASAYPPVITQAPSINPTPSTIPVVSDLDLGIETRSFKSGRKSAMIAALVALPLLGGGGYALTQLDQPPQPLPKLAAAPPPPATNAARDWNSPAPSTPAEATPPAPTPSTSDNSPASSDTKTSSLSEDVKKALLEKDQARPKGKSAKKGARGSAAVSRGASSKKGSKGPFSAGGSKDDPLNSNL